MNTKQQIANQRAKELDIDKVVRIVAASGKHDAHKINFFAEFKGMDIRATFGAGTNSASVRFSDRPVLEPKYLYNASDYGRYIETFRHGPWVHRLIEEADRISALNEAKKQALVLLSQQSDNFKEIDF